ncbi:Got1 family protein [Cardiosporidium cionae]|uniref:Got1 family protein n=1 Tax=Cardiosporidium cionae TaxID=476202 RepID=A0ABQ7J3X3_9APIC|nr:Got1 family protein [Cardiosporidium cionae]|eukprot:KAF8817790.1 Got1 family protein [Cardiosporidium cionae]
MLDDNKKIGIGLCAIGLVLGGVGLLLFFDRALLSLGNIVFLIGLFFLMGSRSIRFFFRKEKFIGSLFYLGGIGVIIFGWAMIGWLLEMYGLWKLFASFLPSVVTSLSLTPVGYLFNLPGIKQVTKLIQKQRRLPLPLEGSRSRYIAASKKYDSLLTENATSPSFIILFYFMATSSSLSIPSMLPSHIPLQITPSLSSNNSFFLPLLQITLSSSLPSPIILPPPSPPITLPPSPLQ